MQPDWLVWSRFPLRPLAPPPPAPAAPPPQYGDWVLDTIAPDVDGAFYRAVAGLGDGDDPVRHFAERGWQAGLNPNTWFDTKFYLDFYPDIAEAGMNPLFHFIYYGRAEGRLPARPGGLPRHVVEQARIPSRRPPGWDAPDDAPHLDTAALGTALSAACRGRKAIVLAVSHDCYVHVTGGMQILIADEQALFNADRTAYLHIAPAIARFTFAPPGEEVLLQVSLDGVFLGLAPESMVEAALRAPFLPPRRLLIVHSLLGHRATALARLAAVLGAVESFFWLHDYAALCEGFNLLRNDIAHCHAPPPDSTACRICVYGAERHAYLAAMASLFAALRFHVLAPSRVALDLFLARTALPFRTARVHDNLVMLPGEALPPEPPTGPPRIAFAGFAIPPKGWPPFQRLLQRQAGHATYRFLHFAVKSNQVKMTGLEKIDVEVRPRDRFAMVTALRAAAVDLVAVLSPWPETFSFVAHEAFAAGADVIALEDGGNVAAAVRRYRRGVVLRDADAVLRFFEEGWALDYVRQQAAEPRELPRLLLTGTTATLDPARLTQAAPDSWQTDDPALVVLAADGRPIAPDAPGCHRYTLPPATAAIRLVSRHAIAPPRHGVPIARLALDGAELALDDPRLAEGWQPPEPGRRWTTGDAMLRCPGVRRLDFTLAPGASWRRVPLAG
ncbi:MAG: hypothetical protein IT555_21615 [Acetobacteraceae bacterium]|nr:hypothetical protein [Acetobacteraceae bacterium]